MSYKTILVHLNRAARCRAVLEPTLDLARKHSSHVIGLYVRPRLQAAVAVDSLGNAVVLEDEIAAARDNEQELAAAFADLTTKQPFAASWRAIDAQTLDLGRSVLEHGFAADLIVASQNDPDWNLSSQFDFPERLILESGRPVLTIPYVGAYPEVGKTVVVAWKPGREAARAVFNALPILKAATVVHILQISTGRDHTIRRDDNLTAALALHGVKAELHSSYAADQSVGNEILSRLADFSADLLVMGAYGHTRLREYVFGGTTRDIVKQMTVPTLFSH